VLAFGAMNPTIEVPAALSTKRRFSRYHLALLALFLAVWAWSAIDPVFPDDWWLENILVFAGVPLIVGLGFYFRLSNLSYTLITVFMMLHAVGSHYTYAEVPFGFTLQNWFGAERNMYDRLVHCSFGLLLAYPVREVFVRITRARGVWSYYLPVELTLAFSAIYELMEWAAAAGVPPEAGLAFLGAQGDVWDAQKDMGLAGLGSIVAMIVTFLIVLRIDPDATKELRESLTIPPDDQPIGEKQVLGWLARRRARNRAAGD
jgi:putative membrane protein